MKIAKLLKKCVSSEGLMMEKREGFFCFRKGVSHIHPPKYALFDLSVEAPSPRATLFFAAYWLGAL